ncbi:hypothetical protein DF3PA_180056 [Candidatus Defluviicoccus seviourii]|uniref:Uncharacterized protein n=1 Tax=Candidatus Defluviicoccus seviourii TaxID=2565273 RepID=A0A564WC24_9PROT|nr:hypothetical protein DF3PA_180056 [Candidatus Defluviicoccus seviourii]
MSRSLFFLATAKAETLLLPTPKRGLGQTTAAPSGEPIRAEAQGAAARLCFAPGSGLCNLKKARQAPVWWGGYGT